MTLLSRILCLSAGTSLLALTSPVEAAMPYSGLVAFGDSLTDQGNTISYLSPPGAEDLTGYDLNYYNAAYNAYGIAAEGRWSSGPTWIEYLHGNLLSGITGSAPVALGANYGIGLTETDLSAGTNFAYGGSTTGSGVTSLVIHNLQLQISDYVSLIGNDQSALHNSPVSSTLYSIWSGGNDAIYWIEDGATTPAEVVAATSTLNLQTAVTSLYDAGARHFLLTNLPNLGKKPNYINTPNEALATDFVNAFNASLDQVILTLQTAYTDISITLFDAHEQFDLLLADPESYGFTNTDEASYVFLGSDHDPTSTIVADPETHIFWDYTHPTSQVHQLLGDKAYETLAVPEISHFGLFLTGAATLALFRRRRVAA